MHFSFNSKSIKLNQKYWNPKLTYKIKQLISHLILNSDLLLCYIHHVRVNVQSYSCKSTIVLVYTIKTVSLAFLFFSFFNFFFFGNIAYWIVFFLMIYAWVVTLKKNINTINCHNIFTIVEVLIPYWPK